jgi:hypothetical protein
MRAADQHLERARSGRRTRQLELGLAGRNLERALEVVGRHTLETSHEDDRLLAEPKLRSVAQGELGRRSLVCADALAHVQQIAALNGNPSRLERGLPFDVLGCCSNLDLGGTDGDGIIRWRETLSHTGQASSRGQG